LANKGYRVLLIPDKLVSRVNDADSQSLLAPVEAALMDRLPEANIILINVPTPLTLSQSPNFDGIIRATETVAAQLRSGQLVIVQSITYPGMTRELLMPILAKRDLALGTDFFLACNPQTAHEHAGPQSSVKYPNVVAGAEAQSLEVALSFFRSIYDQVTPCSNLETAEASGLTASLVQTIHLAMVQEWKIIYSRMGIDLAEVLDLDRGQFSSAWTGLADLSESRLLGPIYLGWAARKHGLTARITDLSIEISGTRANYVLEQVEEALNSRSKPIKGSKILLLGVGDASATNPAEVPIWELAQLLVKKGAQVSYHDPDAGEICQDQKSQLSIASESLTECILREKDVVVIGKVHTQFDWNTILPHVQLMVDPYQSTRPFTAFRDRILYV
jgi:UDP-N-acetyl-D-glucosamine dehydrogenase